MKERGTFFIYISLTLQQGRQVKEDMFLFLCIYVDLFDSIVHCDSFKAIGVLIFCFWISQKKSLDWLFGTWLTLDGCSAPRLLICSVTQFRFVQLIKISICSVIQFRFVARFEIDSANSRKLSIRRWYFSPAGASLWIVCIKVFRWPGIFRPVRQ